ncbi:MAG TPA: metallophosphoesterase [Candidatus Saccharimonadales bacterium]|nr:metallophosphoesterase [Candidatus Saccharimonadales bacterium]
MRLHVFSDLHLEFAPAELPPTNADIIVVAGDLDLGYEGCRWLRYYIPTKPVIYVLGNHEFYRHSFPELAEILRRETEGSNIHLLENSAVEINGYRFLGCSLWTDFLTGPDPEAAMQTAEELMNDFRIITNSDEKRVLRARDTVKIHKASVAWLKDELAKGDPSRTIVVTHHGPSHRSEAPHYANSPLNAAFTSNLDYLVERSGVPLWVHGHTHYNVDYKIGATRVVSNQRGYPSQLCNGFDPSLVIAV